MPSPPNFHEEIYALIVKASTWISAILAGVAGKICYELAVKRNLTIGQWLGIAGMSVFIGYISAMWCYHNGLTTQGMVIVPVSTLFGEKIVIYFMANYSKVISRILDIFVKKK